VIDPYSALYAQFWLALETDPEFSSLVKPGNMIRYDETNRIPNKSMRQDADAPEVSIIPVSDTPNIAATSNTGLYMHRMQVTITSLDLRLNRPNSAYPVLWALYRVLARAKDTWKQCYLYSARPVDVTWLRTGDGTQTSGWQATVTVEFGVQINRTAFINGGF
jgi:hypothetical protein